MKPAYYNEIDPHAVEWLRNLISKGLIAPGDVDDRSIEDVHPSDLKPYAQCHFFAGIGVWSYSLRQSGWPDDKQVWTGSCPCQPFSSAGKGGGFTDERHLWPAWFHLIDECRPPIILGEQVASKNADPWIDLVHSDLEALDYAFGCVPFPSAGIGAPHIRDRNYWVAIRGMDNPHHARLEGLGGGYSSTIGHGKTTVRPATTTGESRGVANRDGKRCRETGECVVSSGSAERAECRGNLGRVGDSQHPGHRGSEADQTVTGGDGEGQRVFDRGNPASEGQPAPGPVNGYWRDSDWLFCRDDKWRPVEPSTFPLAHGATARVGRLRAYGNAINAQAAKVFIESVMDHLGYDDL